MTAAIPAQSAGGTPECGVAALAILVLDSVALTEFNRQIRLLKALMDLPSGCFELR